jgi:photosystem I subunit III
VKKILTMFCIISLCLSFSPSIVKADIAVLTPCKDSTTFNKRLYGSIKKLETRLAKYEVSTPPALALEAQINRTKNRFDKYGQAGLLCGADGLPHLIADGRWNRASDFVFPGLLFIYIAGWIGWVGRGYLQEVSKTNKPTEKEIIIDVPLALKFSASGFTWPLAAWQEFTSGKLTEIEENITVSPR